MHLALSQGRGCIVVTVAAAQGRWKYYHGPQMMRTILDYCVEQVEALRSRVEQVRNEQTTITTNPTATTTTTNNDGSGGRWNGYRVSC